MKKNCFIILFLFFLTSILTSILIVEAKNSLKFSEINNQQNITLPILMFHNIQKVTLNSKNKLLYNLAYDPIKFEKLLKYLQKNKIQTFTFQDLQIFIDQHQEIPSKAIILTFDDGYANQYKNAFPLLEKYHQKGVFYIISSKPDKDENYATWSQIKKMALAGHEIGSHTVNHYELTKLPLSKIESEIKNSKFEIEKQIGMPVISFCYPAGKFNQNISKIVKKYYLFARTTKNGSKLDLNNKYSLSTIRVSPTMGTKFLQKLFDTIKI